MAFLQSLRRPLESLIRRGFHLYWRFSRPMTLGVRAVVIDTQGCIFLVQHSYVSGWHLPGGGLEAGETALDALAKELREEGNITLTRAPVLHGVFYNRHVSRRDHVIVFVVRDFEQISVPAPNHEIVATGFFAPGHLPSDTTRGTRARIAEVLGNLAPAQDWL